MLMKDIILLVLRGAGHIAGSVILLIYDEYLSIIGVPIVSKSKPTKFEPS